VKWNIGSVEIHRIEEQLGIGSFPPERYFASYDADLMRQHLDWLVPNHFLPDQNAIITSVHSWLIRTGTRNILIDCCSGNHKNRYWWPRFHELDTPYLERLGRAGVRPEEIDVVLCTHLHADHIGWNTMLRDGRWVPTFPNAKYLFSREEDRFWDPERNRDAPEDPHRTIAYRDSVLPVVAAGQAVLVDDGHAIDESMLVEAAPGHTPGHVIMKLSIESGRALFCGDVMHHPIQVYAPDWNTQFCMLPDAAKASRRRVLEYCAEHRALLFPTHFGAPHVVSIRALTHGFSLNFVEGVQS
jgi:glyoxylase-like metal-dependent hydrolase (beta-lactamase superfamily II)